MYVVSKIVLAVIEPLELVWLRYLVALITLFVIGCATRQSWQIRKKDIPLIVVIGVIGYFGSIWAQFAGTQLSTAQMGDVSSNQIHSLLQPGIYGGVLYIGIVSIAGAFYLWNKGLQMVDAATGGLYFFFQPLVGTLLGWLFLGEQVGITFWLGTLLILGGVWLTINE